MKLAVLALMIAPPTIAGGTAVIESSTETPAISSRSAAPAMTSRTEVAWRDDGMLRFGSAGEPPYMVIRDGSAYSVMQAGGQTRVLEWSSMADLMPGGGQDEGATETAFGSVDAVEATGEREAVAGVEGEVHRLTTTGRNGETVTQEWVLISDPLVTELTGAYWEALSAMSGAETTDTALGQMQAALPEDRRGLLRAGDGFRLVSISTDDPAPELFELPAEPMSIQDMMQGISRP